MEEEDEVHEEEAELHVQSPSVQDNEGELRPHDDKVDVYSIICQLIDAEDKHLKSLQQKMGDCGKTASAKAERKVLEAAIEMGDQDRSAAMIALLRVDPLMNGRRRSELMSSISGASSSASNMGCATASSRRALTKPSLLQQIKKGGRLGYNR